MIVWFSGTGNSKCMAQRLSEHLGDDCVIPLPTLSDRIGNLEDDKAGDCVLWVIPVYSWGIPPYVRRIIREIESSLFCRLTHHLVLICGDDCGMAPEMWRKELKKRSWPTGNSYTVIQPNNYVAMKGFDVDSTEVAEKKLKDSQERVRMIAEDISKFRSSASRHDDVVRGSFPRLKTGLIYPWFVRNAMSPKLFYSTDTCISCGKCANICPLDNIEMKIHGEEAKSRPHWGRNCAGCLACYHVCPVHAVEYGNKTAHKGQYLNPFVDTCRK